MKPAEFSSTELSVLETEENSFASGKSPVLVVANWADGQGPCGHSFILHIYRSAWFNVVEICPKTSEEVFENFNYG